MARKREPTAEEFLASLLAEVGRRARLRKLVERAGVKRDDLASPRQCVRQVDLHREVAALAGEEPSHEFARELRQFLLLEGWKERRDGRRGRLWCSRRQPS